MIYKAMNANNVINKEYIQRIEEINAIIHRLATLDKSRKYIEHVSTESIQIIVKQNDGSFDTAIFSDFSKNRISQDLRGAYINFLDLSILKLKKELDEYEIYLTREEER